MTMTDKGYRFIFVIIKSSAKMDGQFLCKAKETNNQKPT